MILGVLVAGWHLPLVVMGDGALAPIGLLSTFEITIVYVWLLNHTLGSVLLTLIFHATQGSTPLGDLGIQDADLARQEWLECVLWFVAAASVILLDRKAWPTAPSGHLIPRTRARCPISSRASRC